MKFSIIIPTYKSTDSLKIAISSVLYQTYTNFEIIISDDNEINSNEQIETELIAKEYNMNNIVYLKNGHHNGSYARNRGIECATGDYIMMLDDDDFYLNDYLYEANRILEKNNDIELLFFDVITITPENTVKKASHPLINSKKLLYGESEIGTGSNLCFKNNHLLFDERYLRHQDIEFACKAMHRYKYLWIEKLEIVKYFNNIDNYPNVEKAIRMQALLREDMLKNNIINNTEVNELENVQLHSLYNDLLIKNAKKEEIDKVIMLLKNNKSFKVTDCVLSLLYRMSKKLFNWTFQIYSKNKFDMIDDELVCNIQDIRKKLGEKHR